MLRFVSCFAFLVGNIYVIERKRLLSVRLLVVRSFLQRCSFHYLSYRY